MDSVQSLLDRVLHRRGLHIQAKASLVTYKAQQWLDSKFPLFKDSMTAKSLSEGVLCISCKHGIAAQECRVASPALLDHLRKEGCGDSVSDIRIERSKA